ncbi:hypothetical protein [Helicobacter pylori]|uniref:hypothetical protein n=1 Tax=Helicobacter pylori TaxID=210 RepID=UPI000EB1A60C|nr:hypothetical protein [Helicobacter pylori]
MQERVFKRKVLDANILKEMHANNVCYSKHSKDRFIPFIFDKFGYVECKIFKPPKQKSQISLVFGMNALVPLGTIKTLSKTNLDFLYTP